MREGPARTGPVTLEGDESMSTNRWIRWAVAGLGVAAVGFLARPAAAQDTCSTTSQWSTACASVTVSSSGSTVIFGVTNTSTGDQSNSLIDWLETRVSPDEAALLSSGGYEVWVGEGCDPTNFVESADCHEITDQWTIKDNNQGGIEWTTGLSTTQGNDGIVGPDGKCAGQNASCWQGPVYFAMNFDQPVTVEDWALHIKRLCSSSTDEDCDGSDWIGTGGEVPEPVSTTLFGIGLLGWAGSEIRKRRKAGAGDESEADPEV